MSKRKHDYNYHSHTYLCNHAGGEPIDYVKVAIENNYKNLGISEHGPMHVLDSTSRLVEETYPKYLELMKEAEILAKEHGINFYKGLEIEYFKEVDTYEKYLNELDYLILGQHYIVKNGEYHSTYAFEDEEDVKIYVDTVVEALKTGYFNMLAHPDLCFFNIKNPTDEMYEMLRPIILTAKELDIPLEVNANGIRRAKWEDNCTDPSCYKYPRIKFFEMVKEEDAKVIISDDSHSPNEFCDYATEKANEIVEELGLKLVTTLKMNYFKK